MSKTDFALGVLASLVASILYAVGGKAYPHLKRLPWKKISNVTLNTTKEITNEASAILGAVTHPDKALAYWKSSPIRIAITISCLILNLIGAMYFLAQHRLPRQEIMSELERLNRPESVPPPTPKQPIHPKPTSNTNPIRDAIAKAPAGNCSKVIPAWIPAKKRQAATITQASMCSNQSLTRLPSSQVEAYEISLSEPVDTLR